MRTVVISGASTGIGRATALHLRGLGFEVLAGVRREGDAPPGHDRSAAIGGRMATPFVGPYAASKFAMHGFSDALPMELHGQGIHVALIEPGSIATEIWRKGGEAFAQIGTELPPELLRRSSPGFPRA